MIEKRLSKTIKIIKEHAWLQKTVSEENARIKSSKIIKYCQKLMLGGK